MIDSKDLHTYAINVPLTNAQTTKQIGISLISYEIKRYRNICNLDDKLAYQICCTHRIIIPNATPYAPGPQNVTAFDDYPAIVTNNIQITNTDGMLTKLINYFPKTINAAVTTSVSNGSGTIASTSHQHTTGSTTSQSNTFGGSASIGFFGDSPTGGLSADYSHTWGSSKSKSDSVGGDVGNNSNTSGNESMSVKDWACYSYLDTQDTSPTWVWGQEYPWNVVQFNNANIDSPKSDSPILLPNFLIPLLCDETQALPPSQLSLFGIDFTMKSVWLIEPSSACTLSIAHTINYCTASHIYVPGSPSQPPSVSAFISTPQVFTVPGQVIDLCSYGLDPLVSKNTNSNIGAIIGFIPNKFIIKPVPATSSSNPVPFKIISTSNNLMINDTTPYVGLTSNDVGVGFSASETSLTATFTPNRTSLQLTINFKIVDTINDYTLFMKHWKTNTTGVMLQMLINDDSQNIITKYVDTLEAEGGDNNLLSLALRNQDYGSIDYHDFLKLGFNTIQINIAPIGGNVSNSGYQIRAVSIERG